MIEIALAFAAGVLTAAAPCILPLLPVLLGASIGEQDRRRPHGGTRRRDRPGR